MKKIISVIIMLAFSASFIACNQTTPMPESSLEDNQVQGAESANSSSGNIDSNGLLSESEYITKYINPIINIEFSESDKSEIIDHSFLVSVLVSETLRLTGEEGTDNIENDGVYFFPADFAEDIMQRYYSISPEDLKTSPSYDAEVGGYAQPEGLGGFGPAVKIVSSNHVGDILTIIYELDYTELNNPELSFEYFELMMKINDDGSYMYISNLPTEEPA